MTDAYILRDLDTGDALTDFGQDLIRVSDGAEIAHDYGEPEDKTFLRDFKDVLPELNRLAAERDAARANHLKVMAERDAALLALGRLVTWAEWVKAKIHRAPRMDEPNTGAVADARALLERQP